MTKPGEPIVRLLTHHDRRSLAEFECRGFGEPWTDVVEEMVREHLADALRGNHVEALGMWVGERLVGIVAWRGYEPDLTVLRCVLLAVRLGHRRRGYGMRLKKHLVERARLEGARAIVSEVHWENDPIIELNVGLGARIERQPDNPDCCTCIIPLKP